MSYEDADMAIDGFLQRKTSFGAWRERYFRTSLYELSYWSRMIDQIKMTRAVVASHDKLGSYSYAPIGQASETYDLRIPGTEVVAGKNDNLLIEIRVNKTVILDARALNENEKQRWLDVLRRIVDYERSLAARPLGALRIEIDGIYCIGDDYNHAALSATIDFEEKEYSTDKKQPILLENALYENLDQNDDIVSFASLQLDTGPLPVRRVNDSFGITLNSTSNTIASSSTDHHRAAVNTLSSTAKQIMHQDKSKIASHRVTLFEVLYLNEKYARDNKMASGALCAFEGDATGPWPLRTPDGIQPKHGYFLYPVLDRDVGDNEEFSTFFENNESFLNNGILNNKKIKKIPKLIALIQLRIRYWENLLKLVDLDGHDRFEFENVADDDKKKLLEKHYKGGDSEGFTTEALTRALERYVDIAEKLSNLADVSWILAFEKPVFSFLAWIIIAITLLLLPPSACLAFIPLIFMALLLAAAATRDKRRSELFKIDNQRNDAELRDVRLIRIAILKANNIAAADFDIVTGKHSDSDPFVALMVRPGDNRVRKSEAIAPTLIGITTTRQNTLNPEWIHIQDEVILGPKGLGQIVHLGKAKNTISIRPPSSTKKEQPRNLPLARTHTRRTILSENENTTLRRSLAFGSNSQQQFTDADTSRAIDQVASQIIIEQDDQAIAGVDATKIPSSLRQLLGPNSETCCPAPADFRASWLIMLDKDNHNDSHTDLLLPSASSWTFPVLQETAVLGWGAATRLVPWIESQGTVQLELFDANITSQQVFLGQAQLPLQELALREGRATVFELPLEPSDDSKRDRLVVSRHLAENKDLGTITVIATLEPALGETNYHVEAYKRKLCAETFETKLPTLNKKSTVSAYGNVKDIRRSLNSALQTLEGIASLLERGYCLLTWQCPSKSAIVLAGLMAGVCALVLIPNNLLVLAFLSNKMLTGLVKKIKIRLETEPLLVWHFFGYSEKEATNTKGTTRRIDPALRLSKPDSSEVQMKNFLKSLPNGPQRDRALANRRYVAAAQHARNQIKARIALQLGLRVSYQNYIYILRDLGVTAYWERKYALVVDYELLLFNSIQEALIASSTAIPTTNSTDSNNISSTAAAAKKRAIKLKIVQPPLGGCWRNDEDVPHYATQALPAASMITFFLAVYLPLHSGQYTLNIAADYYSFNGKNKKRPLEPTKHLFALKSQSELNDFIRAVQHKPTKGFSRDHSSRPRADSIESAVNEEDPATTFSPTSSNAPLLYNNLTSNYDEDEETQVDIANLSIISPNWSRDHGGNCKADDFLDSFPFLSGLLCSSMNQDSLPDRSTKSPPVTSET